MKFAASVGISSPIGLRATTVLMSPRPPRYRKNRVNALNGCRSDQRLEASDVGGIGHCVDLDQPMNVFETRLANNLEQVARIERRFECPMHAHLLDQRLFALRAFRRAGAFPYVDRASGNKRPKDHAQRFQLIVEVVHGVVEDRGVEAVDPGHLANRHRIEFGKGLDPVTDLFRDSRHTQSGDLDHVLRNVDACHPVPAPREVLAHPARPAAHVEDLRAQAES